MKFLFLTPTSFRHKISFRSCLIKRFGALHGHAPLEMNLELLTKYHCLLMLLNLRNSGYEERRTRKVDEFTTLLERTYPNAIRSPQSEEVSDEN